MRRGIVILALLTCACGFFGSNPKKSVSKFLDALAESDYAEAYEYVSAKDREFKDLQTFSSVPTPALFPEGISTQSEYQIESVSINGDRAEVRVAFSRQGSEGGGPVVQVFEAIKEGKKWGVLLNWEAESLIAEGDRLRGEDKLREALQKYNQALELDPDNRVALAASSEVEREVALLEIKASYRQNHVEILGFRVRPDDRRSGPGTSVSGKILNNGHRTLSEVEVTIYFVSEDGQIVAERMFRPIPSADVTYVGEKGYLKRGYVKDFGYILDSDLPRTWSGRARALVTKIEFEESA